MGRTRHTLRVLDAIYRLDRPHHEWLGGLLEAIEPRFGGGLGATAIGYRLDGDRRLDWLVMEPGLIPAEDVHAAAAAASASGLRRVFSAHPAVSTISARLCGSPDEAHLRRHLGKHDILDVAHLNAVDEGGGGLLLGCPLPRESLLGARVRGHWARVALHLGAALRLRRRLGGAPKPQGAAGVFSPGGRLLHAEPALRSSPLLGRLRDAVLARVALEGADAEDRVALWPSLVAGRWSIVDAFDRDGARYLVALENPAAAGSLRALGEREAQVVEGVGRGQSNKAVAYALGIAEGTVAACLRDAMRKLGVRRRAQLIALARLAGDARRVRLGGDGAVALVPVGSRAPSNLSAAERDVLERVARGQSNREIARDRGSSARTVANQIAAILRKAGAGSRYELMAGAGAASPCN